MDEDLPDLQPPAFTVIKRTQFVIVGTNGWQIMNALATSPLPMNTNQIKAATKIEAQNLQKSLRSLKRHGIVDCSHKGRTTAYITYNLTDFGERINDGDCDIVATTDKFWEAMQHVK